jgi:sulfite reductase alpha subunit-like flavoprotein
MNVNNRITEPGYDRDTRHYEFELEGSDFSYEVGDVLAV